MESNFAMSWIKGRDISNEKSGEVGNDIKSEVDWLTDDGDDVDDCGSDEGILRVSE